MELKICTFLSQKVIATVWPLSSEIDKELKMLSTLSPKKVRATLSLASIFTDRIYSGYGARGMGLKCVLRA